MTESIGPTIDAIAILARMAEETRRVAILLAENKSALFDRLAGSGIARIHVEFDGGGDSGQIESIDPQTQEGAVATLPAGTVVLRLADSQDGAPRHEEQTLGEAVETLAYDCLYQSHAGWENNDGAYGTFVFDVAARTIRLEMNERVTESLFSEHEF